jgi:sugar lactone lactonase YvrE
MKKFLHIVIACLVMALPALSHAAETARFVFVKAVYVDDKGKAIKYPEGVACDNKNLLIIADTLNNRLLKYSFKDGDILGGSEIKIPEISFPMKVQVNSKGEIFVLNDKPIRILRLSPEGEFKGYVAPEDLPAPPTFIPRSFKIGSDDSMYILDIFSARVIVLGPDGKFQRAVAFPQQYGFFSDLAIDAAGNIFLIDTLNSQLFIAGKDAAAFSPFSKTEKANLDFPTNLTIDSRGLIYVIDQNGAGIGVFGKDGSFLNRQVTFGWNEGLLRYPSQMCINEKGDAFIADRDNNRIEIFTITK